MKLSTIAAIKRETAAAHEKHGHGFEQASHDAKLRILVEEVGEIARALNEIQLAEEAHARHSGEWTTEQLLGERTRRELLREHMMDEVAQVASLAVRWMDHQEGR